MSNLLLLPGNPWFDEILFYAKPPDWQQTAAISGDGCAFVEDASTGLLRPVGTFQELEEYMYGGEGYEVIDNALARSGGSESD